MVRESEGKAMEMSLEVLRKTEDVVRDAVDDVEEVYKDLLKLGQGHQECVAVHEKMKLKNTAAKNMVDKEIDDFGALNHGLTMDAEQRLRCVKEESGLFLEKRRCQATAEVHSLMSALQDNNCSILDNVIVKAGHLMDLLRDIVEEMKMVEVE